MKTRALNIVVNLIFFLLFIIANPIVSQNQNNSLEDGIKYLSEYIASKEFSDLRKMNNDIELIDTLYLKSKSYFNNDVSESLLALAFTTLPFREMPIRLPILNIKIPLKLPTVNEKLFIEKRNNLPGKYFFDSPPFGLQDKDKIAHFFGNAFLSYNISFIKLSKFLSIMVEIFESDFKVSGGVDYRDIQANTLGELFGYLLNKNIEILPSEILRIYNLFYFSYYF